LNMLWPSRLRELSSEGYWLVGWGWAGLSFSVILGGAAAPRLLDVVGRRRLVQPEATTVALTDDGLLLEALQWMAKPIRLRNVQPAINQVCYSSRTVRQSQPKRADPVAAVSASGGWPRRELGRSGRGLLPHESRSGFEPVFFSLESREIDPVPP